MLNPENNWTHARGLVTVTESVKRRGELMASNKDGVHAKVMMKNLYGYSAISLVVSLLIPLTAVADLDVLIIGSTHSYSEQGESGAVQEKAFSPALIATELQSILENDPLISETVNVVSEDIYKSKSLDTAIGSAGTIYNFTYHCYSLTQHYMWPEGKTNRLANYRCESGTNWNYIVIMADPYLMANMPGMFAEGAALLIDEIRKGSAQPVLLAQWPEHSSSFTATNFAEVVCRIGDSYGVPVVPAGMAWDSLSGQDMSPLHPTPDGAYLAAASIYSEIYNRNAKSSAYHYDDAIADHALSQVQANKGGSPYSGKLDYANPFSMQDLTKRKIKYNETGSSSEGGIENAGFKPAMNRCIVGYTKYDAPASWPAGVAPVDVNLGRGNDWFEDSKDYDVNPSYYDMTYGFPMQDDDKTGATTMLYGIDKRYHNGSSYEDGTDLGIAYNMIREGEIPAVRCIPIRTMWAKIQNISPSLTPHSDSWHMTDYLDEASGTFMYTLISGRCPMSDEPAQIDTPEWYTWLGRKIGYETAWRMSQATARAPGFRVLPSGLTATNVTPATAETLTVNFMLAPTSDVTVVISSADPYAGKVIPNLLTFTPSNYNDPQTVSVLGETGVAGSYPFDVVLSTVSDDVVYNGLSDKWDFYNTRPDGPTPPSIRLLGNGISIPAGSTTPSKVCGTDFGIVSGAVTNSFAITNISESITISLTNSPRVTVVDSAGNFSLSQDASTGTLDPGGFTTFDVTYEPPLLTGSHTHTAVVTVASTDASLPVYSFSVSGISIGTPTVLNNGYSLSDDVIGVTLSGLLSAGAAADAWIFWGDHDAGESFNWDHAEAIGRVDASVPFSTQISGLMPETTYYYRVYATNAAGVAWADSTESFTTARGFYPYRLPYEETFESYADGTSLLGNMGWRGDHSNLVTTLDYAGNYQGGPYPAPAATHSNVLVNFDDSWSSNVFSAAGVGNVWVDQVINMEPSEVTTGLFVPSDAKCWFVCGTNGHLYVYHGQIDGGNVWTELSEPVIGTGDWVRITVNFDFDTADNVNNCRYFRLYLNGELISNASAYDRNDGSGTAGGEWFPLGVNADWQFNEINYYDAVKCDDIVVGTVNSISGSVEHYITVTEPVGGSVVPNGVVAVPDGGTTNFLVTPNKHYYISAIMTNDMSVGAVNTNAGFIDFVWSNITANGTLEARVISKKTSNGKASLAWLEAVDPAWSNDFEAAALADPDGDGLTTAEEYWAGTDPTNVASVLQFDEVTFDGATINFKWKHAKLDPALPPLRIEKSSDLVEGNWTMVDQVIRTNDVNKWSEAVSFKAFYRLVATNSVPVADH